MIRVRQLPQEIQRAINGWRVWVTLLILAGLIINESVNGLKDGESIVQSLTRITYLRMLLLAFVCGVIAQATIGAIPFTIGVTMTMIDFALRRRREWRDEGRNEGIEQGRAEERRRIISAIVADPNLTDEAKLQAIAAINSAGES